MLAKLIVHGRDRNEAIQKMKCALDELVIEGLNTNIDFHKKVMRHELFNSANYDTTFAQQLSNE
jgi:acetyl-CoA carboxylase biotin carboxylase subunit